MAINISNPIQAAINYLSSHNWVPNDNNIYVEAGTYTEDVTVNGSSWTSTPSNLGLIGNGSSGSGATILNGSITISNMVAFTLQGFDISGNSANGTYISADNNTGELAIENVNVTNTTSNNSGNGISVINQKGPIYLDNAVESDDNKGAGASLDNTSCISNCYVNVQSIFLRNGTDGLDVTSDGEIDLGGVIADNNGTSGTGSGAVLSTTSTNSNSVQFFGSNQFSSNAGTGLKVDSHGGVIIYNSSSGTFNSNGANGLEVYADGTVTLYNVLAKSNTSDGAKLGSSANPILGNISLNDSTLGGNLSTAGNKANGLEVYANGNVTLHDVTADNNTGNGAKLGSSASPILGKISIDYSDFGDSSTYGNKANGLEVYSDGVISLDAVGADYNNYDGAYLFTTGKDANGHSVYIDYNTGNLSNFSNNLDNQGSGSGMPSGLEVNAPGAIYLSDVTADSNGGNGATLDSYTKGSVLVDNAGNTGNDFSGNGANGIEVYVHDGNVTLYNIAADDNTGNGARLGNSSNPIGGNIYIDTDSFNDVGGFSYFGEAGDWNGANGLVAYAKGDIILYNITADANKGDGTYLDNSSGTGNIRVSDSIFGETVSSLGNVGYGLEIHSSGNNNASEDAIDLYGVTADYNGLGGARLDGAGAGNHYTVNIIPSNSMTGNEFSYNGSDGLDVTSPGQILLADVVADYNGQSGSGAGAVLNNVAIDSPSVTIYTFFMNHNDFSHNHGDGLDIISHGGISLTDVAADYNNGQGAYIGDTGGSWPYAVTIGVSSSSHDDFNNNQDNGLEVFSNSSITLTDVIADDNTGGNGAYLNNCIDTGGAGLCTGSGNVVVDPGASDSSAFNGNHFNGLSILSTGSVSLNAVTAVNNSQDGALLDNCYALSDFCAGVTDNGLTVTNSVFGDSVSGGNGWNGLEAYSNGLISLSNVTADHNTLGDGAALENDQGDTTEGITVNNTSGGEFNENGGNGLEAYAIGAITLTDVNADNNGNYGAYLASESDISVDPGSFSNNGSDGLFISAGGNAAITCDNVANNNGGYGVDGTAAGIFTNGLTATGNTLGGSNVTGYSSLVDGCHPGGGGGASGPAAGGAGQLPWNTINVLDSAGQGHALDCTQYAGTEMVLPNGDHVLMPCPIGSAPGTTGSLNRVINDNLPGKLDGKYTFVSAFDTEINPALSGGMITVGFKIPAGKQSANFTILHWDGSKWVSLGGLLNPPGYFSVQTNLTGNFVLVTQ